jgi:hypothetical protein
VYIPFPVRISDAATGETIDQPMPARFQGIFQRDRSVVSIVGGGGSGKTTLACALARWAIADEATGRLQPQVTIPVIIAEDTKDLLSTVIAELKKMVSADAELESDIAAALLKRKRILVIVDALSERSAETQSHVSGLFGSDTPINAMIVTTRREPKFGPVENTWLYPLPLDLKLLVPFIMEYIRRKELTNTFSPQQQLALAQRILQIVEAGGGLAVTPLLVTLFVDAAVGRTTLLLQTDEMPIDVPEVYLDYLERLNPTDPTRLDLFDHKITLAAAIILARASLGEDLVPTDFRRDDAEKRLLGVGLASAPAIVDRLISNNVIQEQSVAGLSLLRFHLDPVAEYLVAIATCRELGEDQTAWQKTIANIVATPKYPDATHGFLTALSVCYASYQRPLKLARVEFPWAEMMRISPEKMGAPLRQVPRRETA